MIWCQLVFCTPLSPGDHYIAFPDLGSQERKFTVFAKLHGEADRWMALIQRGKECLSCLGVRRYAQGVIHIAFVELGTSHRQGTLVKSEDTKLSHMT